MTIQKGKAQAASKDNFMTSDERAFCQQIAAGEAPHSGRARALLALDAGSTQAQAAKEAGLSTGQVRYWLARFLEDRLGIFPDGFPSAPVAKMEDIAANKSKDKKVKKSKVKTKKGKKEDGKGKKSKKSKKDKKGKKSKKKSGKGKKKKHK